MSTPEIVRLLRAIADVIERSDSTEVRAVAEALEKKPSSGRRQSSKAQKNLDLRSDLDLVTSKLMQISDRGEGRGFLASLRLSRADLTLIGRKNNVHILKEDNLSAIEDKIIESLIGARLNSKAIRGENS
ncbi:MULTISPECIES: hypothetical protein [Roseomonadaceae]|uniref:Flagellar protein FlgN n=1 Tax=Falsiroseomonas oleicola TaxID=2801474 RepID=A0ABS6HDR5_9PROT|nr:hypothetical protein [Roseomonas oleicola]MBU8546849.1 hypothetical protein [Roseomonas oleicola]